MRSRICRPATRRHSLRLGVAESSRNGLVATLSDHVVLHGSRCRHLREHVRSHRASRATVGDHVRSTKAHCPRRRTAAGSSGGISGASGIRKSARTRLTQSPTDPYDPLHQDNVVRHPKECRVVSKSRSPVPVEDARRRCPLPRVDGRLCMTSTRQIRSGRAASSPRQDAAQSCQVIPQRGAERLTDCA